MKKNIRIIFFSQLIFLSILSLVIYFKFCYVRYFYNYKNISHMDITFQNQEGFEAFLLWSEEKDVEVYSLYSNYENELVLHMNKVALENELVIKDGLLPKKDEFVSNKMTDDSLQCGLIKSFIPKYCFKVYELKEPEKYGLSTLFVVNTISSTELNEIERILEEYGCKYEFLESKSNSLVTILLSSFSSIQISLVVIFVFLSFVVLLTTLIQYVIQKNKTISVMKLLGYDRNSITKEILKDSLFDKTWIITVFSLLLIIILTTLSSNDYRDFLLSVIIVSVGVIITLSFLYFIIISSIVCLFILMEKEISLELNGMKHNYAVQLLLCFSKGILTLLFIVSMALTAELANQFITEVRNIQCWSNTKDIYRISMNYVGQDSDLELEVELQKKVEQLYKVLEKENEAFFMDANDIYTLDMLGADFPLTGLTTDGWNTHITVSPNYFKFNHIYTCDGVPVEECLIYDESVLNILVPEGFSSIIPELEKQFLEYFRFYRIGIYENVYSEASNDEWNPDNNEELMLNIIKVQNNQSYFTFSPYIRIDSGNMIIDPVVVVYTDNFHPSSTFTKASRCLYFKYDGKTEVCNKYLTDILKMKGFVYATPIYNEISERINQIRHNGEFGLFVTVFVLGGYLLSSYCLLFNYYSFNKKYISIKRILGYGLMQQSANGIVLFFSPTIVASISYMVIKKLKLILALTFVPIKYSIFIISFMAVNDIITFIMVSILVERKNLNSFLKGEIL